MLDQGQTITVNSVDRDYNLIQFDGLRTQRLATLTDGNESILVVDHTKSKTADANNRHLHSLQTAVESESGEQGTVIINVTISGPKWATAQSIQDEFAGFSAWITTVLPQTLGFQS